MSFLIQNWFKTENVDVVDDDDEENYPCHLWLGHDLYWWHWKKNTKNKNKTKNNPEHLFGTDKDGNGIFFWNIIFEDSTKIDLNCTWLASIKFDIIFWHRKIFSFFPLVLVVLCHINMQQPRNPLILPHKRNCFGFFLVLLRRY